MNSEKPPLAITKPDEVLLPVSGSDSAFPVGRVFCVGRNYSEHVKEMGGDIAKSTPVFFMKPPSAVVAANPELNCKIPYPAKTSDLHHEVELVVAIKKGGVNIEADNALEHVFGYGVGVDLTRRDLQSQAKKKSAPWEVAKAFDMSAPTSNIVPMGTKLTSLPIWLSVNGDMRQQGNLGDMIYNVADIVAILSTFFKLQPGDLIFTGTPEGVGAIFAGDRVSGAVDGLAELSFQLV